MSEQTSTIDTVDTVSQPVTEPVASPKRKPGRPKSLANLTPFDSERAKAISAKANAAKRARSEMRRRMLAAVCQEGLDKHLAEAIKNHDETMVNIVEKASKLVGIDFQSSEEFVTHSDVKQEATVKADHKLSITFTDAEDGGK